MLMKNLSRSIRNILITSLLLVLLSACGPRPTRYPAGTTPGAPFNPPTAILPEPAKTSEPINPEPESPPSDLTSAMTGEAVDLPKGGFSFIMPANPFNPDKPYQLQLRESQVSLANKDESLLISLISEYQAYDVTVDDCILLVVDKMTRDVNDLQAQDANEFKLGSDDAYITRISGTLFKQPFSGALVAARPWAGRCFTAIALSTGKNAPVSWGAEGELVFNALLGSLRFFNPQVTGQCETSPDPAYGTTPEQPIRVGNTRLTDGLARMLRYLSVLVTQNGKSISYARIDSQMNGAGDILDVFQIGLPDGASLGLLYLDMYHYEAPKAPLNFSCNTPIPLAEP